MDIKRIVVGVEDSPDAAHALAWSIDLATALGAEVVAVHATNPVSGMAIRPDVTGERLARDASEACRTQEHTWCETLRRSELAWRFRLVHDDVQAAILTVAEEEDADLIVIGWRGLGRLAELLVDSVHHGLLHASTRPVVVVPTLRERGMDGTPHGHPGLVHTSLDTRPRLPETWSAIRQSRRSLTARLVQQREEHGLATDHCLRDHLVWGLPPGDACARRGRH